MYRWAKNGRLQLYRVGPRTTRVKIEDLRKLEGSAWPLYEGRDNNKANDELTAEELTEAEGAWQDYLSGRDPGKSLNEVRRELQEERRE